MIKMLLLCLLTSGAHAEEELVVSAAASLSNAFKQMAQQFSARHPDTKVALNFAASGTLLLQLKQGATVDVFASADQETMDQAAAQQLIDPRSRRNFTHNSLVMITPLQSHESLRQLTDLKKNSIKRIALGNPAYVPAGRYAKQALVKANMWTSLQNKVVLTQNVRQALDYVARDNVEVGFVYSSDAYIMHDSVVVKATVVTQPAITYPIAQVAASQHTKLANDFIRFVLSDAGQTIMAKYGFTSGKVAEP